MLIKKIFTLTSLLLISSLFISCASKEITAVKNANSILTDIDNNQITTITNKEIINSIITDVKWTESITDNGTKYVYATGKYIDIEQAKKNAYLTQLFFMVILSENGIDWDQADPIMYVKYMIGIKKTTDDYFLLGDTSKGTFMFNAGGEIEKPDDKALYFNFIVFLGYNIALSGMDKIFDLPIIDNF